MKVFLLTDCLTLLAGGAEKQIYKLAEGLAARKHDVHIFSLTPFGTGTAEKFIEAGCHTQFIPVKRIYGLSGLVSGIAFYKLIKQIKPDVVMTYHFGSDIWGTIIAHLAGVKVIISNRRDMGFWRNNQHIRAYGWVNQWVTKVVVNAQSILNYVKATEDVPKRNIEVIYNGVDFPSDQTQTIPSDLTVKPGSIVVMHVANLKPIKGHRFLLEALKELVVDFPQIQLFLIGEDTMNGEIQQLASQLKISEHILFLGKRTDVKELLSLADICVLPSLSEGMSNSILEYMVAGKPVIATNVGGTPELVEDQVTGLLVEKENSKQLKDAFVKLLKDRPLQKSMGEKGRQKALDYFSNEGMVKRYEDLFTLLLPKQIQIMHFISSGGFYGAENVLLNLVTNMDKEIYRPIVAVIQDGRRPNLQVAEKARELKIPIKVFQSKGRIDFDTVSKLRRCLVAHKIDVLHTHNYKSDIIGVLATRNLNVKLIATAHGFTDINNKVTFYEKLDRWFLKRYFDRVVVVAEAVLRGTGLTTKIVIQNGINVKQFQQPQQCRQEIRQKYGILDNEILIGTVGRFSVEKNQKLLIAAADKICRSQLNVKIMIIGEGQESDQLQGRVRSLGLEKKVIFTGHIRNVAPFYKAFDIFTLTSLTEGVPMVILEAMASGTPVVATRVGGIPQLVSDGRTGLLVDSNDLAALCSAFEKLISNESLRKNLVDHAFQFVQQEYSVERMTNAYSKIYREVLE